MPGGYEGELVRRSGFRDGHVPAGYWRIRRVLMKCLVR